MLNIVAGTRSQPPTISTMVFVSQNCHLANSISQQQPPLACRIRQPYPIVNPHKGHDPQLLAYQPPLFSRKQAARYNTNKPAKTLTTRWRLRGGIAFRQIQYRSIMVPSPAESDGGIPSSAPTRDIVCNCWPTMDPRFHENKPRAITLTNAQKR